MQNSGCVYSRRDGPAEAYDVLELRRLLTEIKEEMHEQNVILVPEPDVPYEVLVLTMDATRENPDAGNADGDTEGQCNGRCLFPFVVIAGGVQQ